MATGELWPTQPDEFVGCNVYQVLKGKTFILKSLAYDSVHRADLFKLPCAPSALEAYLARPDITISSRQPWILQEFIKVSTSGICNTITQKALWLPATGPVPGPTPGMMLALKTRTHRLSCTRYTTCSPPWPKPVAPCVMKAFQIYTTRHRTLCRTVLLPVHTYSLSTPSVRMTLHSLAQGKEFSCYTLSYQGRVVAHADTAAELSNLNYKYEAHPGIRQWVQQFAAGSGASGQVRLPVWQTLIYAIVKVVVLCHHSSNFVPR